MLLDRRVERGHIDRVLAAAREGLSGVLVLRGEPGIGKTALLDYAVEAAADLRVVRLAGIESEMELGFSSLHQALLPFLGGLEGLPAPQGAALGSAFGLRDGGLPDRLLVGLASLSLLAAAASTGRSCAWWMTRNGWIGNRRRFWRSWHGGFSLTASR